MSARPLTTRHPSGQELQAHLQHWHLRGLKLASLRWLALASVPVWLQALGGALPELPAFWASLGYGACLVLAVVYALLEQRWSRRAAQLADRAAPRAIRVLWTTWDDVRCVLWEALAIGSLVPWSYAVLGRPMPGPLLCGLVAVAAAMFLLLVAVETIRWLGPAPPTG